MRMFSDSDDELIAAIKRVNPDAEIPYDDLTGYADKVLNRAKESASQDSDELSRLAYTIRKKKGDL